MKLKDYIKNIDFSNSYNENLNSLIKLSSLLDSKGKDFNVDFYYNILATCPNINNIVKNIVDNNFDRVNSNNISSICSKTSFVSFVEVYCINNGIDLNCDEQIDDSLSSDVGNYYFDLLSSFPILTVEEEAQLFKLLKSDDADVRKKAKNRLTNCNLRLVVSIAAKFNFCLPFDDLVSEGNIGLVKAIERFDYTRGCKFSTYAYYWIKMSIIRAIRTQTNNIRIPHNIHDKINLYKNTVNSLENKLCRRPSCFEVSDSSGLSIEQINVIENCLSDVVSLDTAVDEDGDTDMYSFISDGSISIENISDNNELHEIFYSMFNKLGFSDRQIDILTLKYGLNGEDEQTLDYIGKKYNITRERVRQIIYRLLCKIKSDKKCMQLLAEFMPNSSDSFKKTYMKRSVRD